MAILGEVKVQGQGSRDDGAEEVGIYVYCFVNDWLLLFVEQKDGLFSGTDQSRYEFRKGFSRICIHDSIEVYDRSERVASTVGSRRRYTRCLYTTVNPGYPDIRVESGPHCLCQMAGTETVVGKAVSTSGSRTDRAGSIPKIDG